jgi:hypothetical protein
MWRTSHGVPTPESVDHNPINEHPFTIFLIIALSLCRSVLIISLYIYLFIYAGQVLIRSSIINIKTDPIVEQVSSGGSSKEINRLTNWRQWPLSHTPSSSSFSYQTTSNGGYVAYSIRKSHSESEKHNNNTNGDGRRCLCVLFVRLEIQNWIESLLMMLSINQSINCRQNIVARSGLDDPFNPINSHFSNESRWFTA